MKVAKNVLLVALVCFIIAQSAASHSAVTPLRRTDEGGVRRFEQISERVKKGNVDLVFIGDSITHGWEGAGRETWDKYYAGRNAANLGIGGDRTQHVLWRLDNGHIEGIKPKVAVLMLGINNAGANSAQEIADGLTAIVGKLRQKLPETKILLLAIFPCDEQPSPRREKLAQASSLIAGLHDGQHVHFLDIGANLMNPDRTIYKDIMPDFVHLSPEGYAIWAASIEQKLAELLGE